MQGNTAGRQHRSDGWSPHCLSNRNQQSHYRPVVPRGFQEVRFPDYVTMAHDGGKVVSLTRRKAAESCYDNTVAAS